MKTIIVTNRDEKLQKEWQTLWEQSPYANYVNSPHWFFSVIETFGYKEYLIIACYENKKLIGIAGLVKKKRYGITVYTLPPEDFVCGESFLLDWGNKALITTFMKKLPELKVIIFNNLPESFVTQFQTVTDQLSAKKQPINLFFPINKDENGKVWIPKRSRLTNRIRGIEEQFTMVTFDGRDPKGLEVVFSIDKESSKEKSGYSTFANEKTKKFYENLAKRFGEKFWVVILYYREKPIAYYIGFICNNIYYWSQNAYISEYGQYSPGKVLLVKLIDFLGEKEITKVDFGSGDYRMKRLLTDQYQNLYQVTISRNLLVRFYLKSINKIKNDSYEVIRDNILYTVYRKSKNLIKKVL